MAMIIRLQMPKLTLKTIVLLLAACFVLTACQPKLTHVDVYSLMGPHYGDGGG
jgi:ABC-type uncharacterized transport system auxiliary subunit